VKPFATEESYHRRGGRQAVYQHEVLAFVLAGEEYGIDILRLREIIRPRPITEVPRAPAFVLGVIGVRGDVMPVLDLRRRLRRGRDRSAPPPAPRNGARVVVVTREGEAFGLLVDEVRQVVRLRDEDIETRPGLLPAADGEFIAGIARPRPDRLVILLDLDVVLAFSAAGPGPGSPKVGERRP
jgi:purine-binding chemotaxis protein CheW